MNGAKEEPKIIECSGCGCEWNISINADIPSSGYILPALHKQRARKADRKPLIVYTRDNKGNEHITIQSRDEGVVRAYTRDRRREAWAKANGVEKITKEKAHEIWDSSPTGSEDYQPRGRFYYMEGKTIIGINNDRGGAWTEEFKTWEAFKLWITTQMTVDEAEKITRRRSSHGKRVGVRN